MNKRNTNAYKNVKKALDTLKEIEGCFKKILKEYDNGTSTPPSQVCAQNGIDYSRLKRLLNSEIFNNIYTDELIRSSDLQLPEMDPYEMLYRAVLKIDDTTPVEFPVDLIQTVDWLLENVLIEKERNVIILRFGFSEDDGFVSLEETGKTLGLSTERVRQIEARSLRLLRHPNKSKLLKDGLTKAKELDEMKKMTIRHIKEESSKRLKEYEKELENKNYNINGVNIPDLIVTLKQVGIDELDLSPRPYNALLRHNNASSHHRVRNIYDLIVISGYEFVRIRDLGKVSQKEVIEKLNQYLCKFNTTRDELRELLGVDDESDKIINHYHGDWTE